MPSRNTPCSVYRSCVPSPVATNSTVDTDTLILMPSLCILEV